MALAASARKDIVAGPALRICWAKELRYSGALAATVVLTRSSTEAVDPWEKPAVCSSQTLLTQTLVEERCSVGYPGAWSHRCPQAGLPSLERDPRSGRRPCRAVAQMPWNQDSLKSSHSQCEIQNSAALRCSKLTRQGSALDQARKLWKGDLVAA